MVDQIFRLILVKNFLVRLVVKSAQQNQSDSCSLSNAAYSSRATQILANPLRRFWGVQLRMILTSLVVVAAVVRHDELW